MLSEAIQYSVLTTLLSVTNGTRIALLHAQHPEYPLQIVDLTQWILLLSCSVVSLGLTCNSASDYSVVVTHLRGAISVLVPVSWNGRQLVELGNVPHLLAIGLLCFVTCSTLIKIVATMVGTFHHPSMWIGVAFQLCFDYMALSCFYWWLRLRTLREYQTRAQVSYVAVVLSVVSFVPLVIAIVGAVFDRWLLSLQLQTLVVLLSSIFLLLGKVAKYRSAGAGMHFR